MTCKYARGDDLQTQWRKGYPIPVTTVSLRKVTKLPFVIDIAIIYGEKRMKFSYERVFKLAQDKGSGHAELARKHLAKVIQKDVSDFLSDLLA